MDKVKEAGWKDERQAKEEKVITEVDIKTIFESVDIDKSGEISKRVSLEFMRNTIFFASRNLKWQLSFSARPTD